MYLYFIKINKLTQPLTSELPPLSSTLDVEPLLDKDREERGGLGLGIVGEYFKLKVFSIHRLYWITLSVTLIILPNIECSWQTLWEDKGRTAFVRTV